MAKLCEQCGKRNNPFVGDPFSLDVDGKILCFNCAKHIQDDIIKLYYVKTKSEFDSLKNKIISACQQHYNETITTYISARIDKIYNIAVKNNIQIFEDAESNTVDEEKKINSDIGPFENQDLVYTIDGVRGRHIDIYTDKVVITTKLTLGSLITHNATDGEKTVYYSDCVGVQFKQSKFTIGYLQLETASVSGNNITSNFFGENTFTFDTTVVSNARMMEVAEYVKSRVDAAKKGTTTPVSTSNNNFSLADELLKLKQLLDIGVLTQEEFDEQKNKLLNK